MIDRPYRTAALATLLLICCLAIASFSLPARAADDEFPPGIGDVPPGDMRPDSGEPEEGGQAPSGKDLSGPAPSSTPNKQDRSDILGNVPL
jgi:hypothetical protein